MRAIGEVEKEGRVLVLKRIAVTYRLALHAAADRAAVDRAFRAHPGSCPVYRSISPQIAITTELSIVVA